MRVNFKENKNIEISKSKKMYENLCADHFSDQLHCAVLSCFNNCSCIKEIASSPVNGPIFIAVCEEHFNAVGDQVICQNVKNLKITELG